MSLAVLMFFTAAAYVPQLPSAASAPRWMVLSVGVPFLLLGVRSVKMTAAHWFGLALIVASAATMFWSHAPWSSAGALWQLLLFAGAFMIGSEADDETMRKAWAGLALGVAVSTPIAIAQALGHQWVETAPLPSAAGTFLNKDFLAEIALLSAIASLMSRRYVLFLIVMPCVILPMARETIVSVFAVCLVLCLSRGWKMALLGLGLAVAAAALLGYETMADPTRLVSASTRWMIWDVALHHMSLFGAAYGTFGDHMPVFEFAHNEYINMAFELGVLSLLLWAVFAYCLGGNLEIERCVLVAVLASAVVAFPLHLPVTGLVAAVVAGRLARARHTARCLQLDRRASIVRRLRCIGHEPGCAVFGTQARFENISIRP